MKKLLYESWIIYFNFILKLINNIKININFHLKLYDSIKNNCFLYNLLSLNIILKFMLLQKHIFKIMILLVWAL